MYILLFGLFVSTAQVNANDYKYKDWEETTEDYVVFIKNTSTSETTETAVTTTDTSTTTTSSTVTTPSSEQTFKTITEPTAKITINIETTVSDTQTTASNTETTLSDNVTTSTPAYDPATSIPDSILTPPGNDPSFDWSVYPIIEEIRSARAYLNGGHFTASLMVFLDILSKKELSSITGMIGSLATEVQRLNLHSLLDVLGRQTGAAVGSVTQALAGLNAAYVRERADFAKYLIINRRRQLASDINTIIDILDTKVFDDIDRNNIAKVLHDFKHHTSNVSGLGIARAAFEAYVFTPMAKIKGTDLETILIAELDGAITARLTTAPVEIYHRRKHDSSRRHLLDKIATKIINIITITTPSTTEKWTLPDVHAVYHKNEKLKQNIKQRQKEYKQRKKANQKREKRLSTVRGKTPPTTTKKPTTKRMHRSKYYLMKYIGKKLYKMTTKPPTTTRNPWRFYTHGPRTKKTKKRRIIKRRLSNEELVQDLFKSDEKSNRYIRNGSNIEHFRRFWRINVPETLPGDPLHADKSNLRTLMSVKNVYLRPLQDVLLRARHKKNNEYNDKCKDDTGCVTNGHTNRKVQRNGDKKLHVSIHTNENRKRSRKKLNDEIKSQNNLVFKADSLHNSDRSLNEDDDDEQTFRKRLTDPGSVSDIESKLKFNLYKALGYESDFAKTFKRSI